MIAVVGHKNDVSIIKQLLSVQRVDDQLNEIIH